MEQDLNTLKVIANRELVDLQKHFETTQDKQNKTNTDLKRQITSLEYMLKSSIMKYTKIKLMDEKNTENIHENLNELPLSSQNQ